MKPLRADHGRGSLALGALLVGTQGSGKLRGLTRSIASLAQWRSLQVVPSSNWKGADLLEDPLTPFFALDGRRVVPYQRFSVSCWGWVTAGVVSRYYNDVIGGKDQVWQVSEAGFSEQSDTHREATGGMQRGGHCCTSTPAACRSKEEKLLLWQWVSAACSPG